MRLTCDRIKHTAEKNEALVDLIIKLRNRFLWTCTARADLHTCILHLHHDGYNKHFNFVYFVYYAVA